MTSIPIPAAAHSTATLPVVVAAIRRSSRLILRSPALLVSPIAQSLFFLLVYAGQLSTVGGSYLSGSSIISFLLPLILLTGVATGAGTAGTLVLNDITSGYLDRLRLAHGSTTPFLIGAITAVLFGVVTQISVTIAGAAIIGYRPQGWGGMLAMIGVLVLLGLGIALCSVAVAIRSATASTTNLVTLVVFGLSFFTGVFAPVDQLAGWMQVIAAVNPLTYVIDTARQLESGATATALPAGMAVLTALILTGILVCALALNHNRRNR